MILMIGNAHIDLAWFWHWQEGLHEVMATFQSALDRLDEHPEFVFTCACAGYYQWVEENAPDMFARIQERVREGRWVIVGGMWVQPDMNIPSGESISRHLLYSQQYFYKRFGTIVKTGYNVDSFGHNAATPMLLKSAGIDAYVWMRPGMQENANIPQGTMQWQASDGSSVLAYRLHTPYPAFGNVAERIQENLTLADSIHQPLMCFYGVGNHGGGPTIKNLQEIDRYLVEHPDQEISYSSPNTFFEKVKGRNLPLYKGELQHHASGCYSTHSRLKQLHRRAENALLRAEKIAAMSTALTQVPTDLDAFQKIWERLMINQFHDILGGCCVQSVMEDACMAFGYCITEANWLENRALQRMSWAIDTKKGRKERIRSKEDWNLWFAGEEGTPIVVFNPHPFETDETIRICRPLMRAMSENGEDVPVQFVRAERTNGSDKWDSIFRAKIPAFGYRTYWVWMATETSGTSIGEKTTGRLYVENEWLKVSFCGGALENIADKKQHEDLLRAPVHTRLVNIEHCDTWCHNVDKFDQFAGNFEPQWAQVIEQGPVRTVVRTMSRYGTSSLVQDYILYPDSKSVQIKVMLDMAEPFRMVKLCFPTQLTCEHSVAEIGAGVVERQSDGIEHSCQRWCALETANRLFALVNNGKYSYSSENGELCLTLANTSLYADHYGQNERDEFCEHMDMGKQDFDLCLLPLCEAKQYGMLGQYADVHNQPLPYIAETYHEGLLEQVYSGMDLHGASVEVGCVKRAESNDGWVLRIREAVGQSQQVRLDTPAWNRTQNLSFRPWEMKTVFLPDDLAQPHRELMLTELNIAVE